MDGIGAVCVCFWIELLTEFMPMIAGATVVETVEAKAAVVVSKYRSITIAMRTIKGTLFKLVFGAGTYDDLLQNLHGMVCQKLLKVESLSVALLRILRCRYHVAAHIRYVLYKRHGCFLNRVGVMDYPAEAMRAFRRISAFLCQCTV